MNTPAKRYVEIFEEKVENGQSVLRYYGYDRKMHDVGSVAALGKLIDSLSSDCFPNGVPNLDGKTRKSVTLVLTACSCNNVVARVAEGSRYEATFTPSNAAMQPEAQVEMGGVDITDNVVTTRVVREITGSGAQALIKELTLVDVAIPKVTGNIEITITYSIPVHP